MTLRKPVVFASIFQNGRAALALLVGLFMLGSGGLDTVDRMRGPMSLSATQLLAQGGSPVDRLATFEVTKVFDEPIGTMTTVRKKYGLETSRSVTSKFYAAEVSDKLLLIEGGDQVPPKLLIAHLKPLSEDHRTKLLDDFPKDIFLPFMAKEVRDPDWYGPNLLLLGLGLLLASYAVYQFRGLLGVLRPKSKAPTQQEDVIDKDAGVTDSRPNNLKTPDVGKPISELKVREWVEPSPSSGQANGANESRHGGSAAPDAEHRRNLTGPVITLHVVGQAAKKLYLGSGLVIGRSLDCALPIPQDTLASNRHAQLMLDRGVIVLTDMGSSNGTFLNGASISGAEPLSDGDCITIGRSDIHVHF